MRRFVKVLLFVCFMAVVIVGEGRSDSFATPTFGVVCGLLGTVTLLPVGPLVVMLVRACLVEHASVLDDV